MTTTGNTYLDTLNAVLQMGPAMAFVLAAMFFGLGILGAAMLTTRDNRHRRKMDLEETKLRIELDRQALPTKHAQMMADIEGKWNAASSAKQIEGRVDKSSQPRY